MAYSYGVALFMLKHSFTRKVYEEVICVYVL